MTELMKQFLLINSSESNGPNDEELVHEILEQINNLREDEAQIVNAVYFDGLSYRECAKKYNCERGKVQGILRAAITHLKEKIIETRKLDSIKPLTRSEEQDFLNSLGHSNSSLALEQIGKNKIVLSNYIEARYPIIEKLAGDEPSKNEIEALGLLKKIIDLTKAEETKLSMADLHEISGWTGNLWDEISYLHLKEGDASISAFAKNKRDKAGVEIVRCIEDAKEKIIPLIQQRAHDKSSRI